MDDTFDPLYPRGGWCRLSFALLRHMSSDCMSLLSYLMNHNATNCGSIKDWFYCTVRRMERDIAFDRNKQTRVLTKLIKMGLIATEKRGVPPKRWVRLEIEAINRLAPESNGVPMNSQVSRLKNSQVSRTYKEELYKTKKNTQSAPASPSRQRKESTLMSFLPTKESTVISQIDRIRADALHAAIIKKAARKTGWNRRKWSDEFRRLRESFTNVAEGDTRIKKVLAWYCKNVGGEYVPIAACAKSFRSKFERLEAAMNRDLRDNPNIEIGEQAENIAKRQCRKNGWPKGSKDKIPAVAQMSLDNAGKLLKRLSKIAKGDNRVSVFAKKVMSNFAGGHEAFVDRWLDKVHAQVANWSDWSGDLMPWAFSPKHKLFVSMGRGWSQDYSGGTKLWSLLSEELDA